jgi:hypothetical protein
MIHEEQVIGRPFSSGQNKSLGLILKLVVKITYWATLIIQS